MGAVSGDAGYEGEDDGEEAKGLGDGEGEDANLGVGVAAGLREGSMELFEV